ncbi:hypothetical protein DV737_g1334, partial [Chaetothyriales sp. CBS 132003]
MRFLTVAALVATTLWTGAVQGHNILLKAHSRECFHEELHRDDKMTVTFQVGDRESGGAGNLDIDFSITDPAHRFETQQRGVSSGDYSFEAKMDGKYTYCFSNEHWSANSKEVSFNVHGIVYVPESDAPSDPLEAEVRKLSELLSQVKDEQAYIVVRERTHRNTAESTNARVKWWSIFQLGVLVGEGVFQVWWLKRFFEVKRVAISANSSTSADSTEKAAEALEPGKETVETSRQQVRSLNGAQEESQNHPAETDVTTHVGNNHPPAENEKQTPLERSASIATESSAGEPGEDDESKYPGRMALYLLTFGLFLSTFVVALDNTIIATAIPRITTVFNSLDDVGWYGSAYLLTTTSLQPSFGKVYTYFNIKWTYISALFIFEFGSVLCGAAVNSTMLIIGRAVAGAGAAALFSGGMTIVAYSHSKLTFSEKIDQIDLLVAIFFNTLGGAFSVSIAQNIFSNTLIKQIPLHTQGVNPATIIAAGATHIRDVTPPSQLPGVLIAYNIAVTDTFVLSIACAGIATCLSALFEWKTVKGKKLEMGGGA